ncbi:maleylacetoacetate isomerase [Roseateles sp. BYS180W]|uniref:Maleylacetoacetate isomerase n=1 Tax=Roseateles rivi TaxID=3299028 RepID=A0ABW7FYB0_9BURK
MQLYNYYRSSASYRVRIALALKGLEYVYKPVHLARDEHLAESYAAVSRSRLVPQLQDGEHALSQSLAIIEYLDETHPEPPLLPKDPHHRAYVRALALDIACEIHPLNNLRVLRYLVRDLGLSEEQKNRWYQHWVDTGLTAVEQRLTHEGLSGAFCFGEQPGLADCLLVPQIYNAKRFNCRLDHLPTLMAIHDRCMALPAFSQTAPELCPDAD